MKEQTEPARQPPDAWGGMRDWFRAAGEEIGDRAVTFKITCPRGHGLTSLALEGGRHLRAVLPAEGSKDRAAIRDASSWVLRDVSSWAPGHRAIRVRDGTRWRLDCRHPGCGASATVFAMSLVGGCLDAFRRGERRVRLK